MIAIGIDRGLISVIEEGVLTGVGIVDRNAPGAQALSSFFMELDAQIQPMVGLSLKVVTLVGEFPGFNASEKTVAEAIESVADGHTAIRAQSGDIG